jgi:hypothetical protein
MEEEIKSEKEKEVEDLFDKAISLERQKMEIVDKVWEIDETAGSELNELLADESYLRS